MLKAGVASAVKFNVDVHGTGAEPKVRLVFKVSDKELGFTATQLDDKWQAMVELPADTPAGEYDMRVEVTLNNRLFTPMKRRVEVEGATAPQAPAPTQAATPVVAAPQPQPQVTAESKKPLESLIKRAAKPMPERPAPSPAKAPKPTAPQTPVKPHDRIKMADIANDSSKKFDKALKESASYKKPITPVKPLNFSIGTPVSLKRGDIVYE